MSSSKANKLHHRMIVVGASVLAGFLLDRTGWPAAWLVGPVLATSILSLSGFGIGFPTWVRPIVLAGFGIYTGTTVTPALLGHAATWPFSILGLFAGVTVATWATQEFIKRSTGCDRSTAVLSAFPGSLSVVMALALETKSDVRQIAIIQSVRLVTLIAVLPALLALFGYYHASHVNLPQPSQYMTMENLRALGLLVGAAFVGFLLFRKIRFPAAQLTGPLIAAALLCGSGTLTAHVPPTAVNFGSLMLGMLIGDRFDGMSVRQVLRYLGVGIGALLILILFCGMAAVATAELVGLPFNKVLLAFAPGAMEAMIVLSVTMAIDPTFVAAHHIARFVAVSILTPLIAPRLTGDRKAADPPDSITGKAEEPQKNL